MHQLHCRHPSYKVKLVIASKSSHTFNQHTKSGRIFLNKIIYNCSQSSSGNNSNITSATSEDKSSTVPPETLANLDTQSEEKPASQVPKKTPLTAREKLRAARVLSRYNDSKPSSKMGLGSKVLDALRESDGGKKRSGLPQAPTNLFDDSKRGMPKPGLTFDFPGGADLFYIVLSVVFISTVMFTTTFVVWKLGAIHFNEY